MVINIHEKEAQAKTSSAWNDILNFQNQLSDEEQILQSSVKSYCRDKLLPRIVTVSYTHLTLPTIYSV